MVMVNVEKEKDWDEWRKFNGKLQIGDKKRKKSLSRMTEFFLSLPFFLSFFFFFNHNSCN